MNRVLRDLRAFVTVGAMAAVGAGCATAQAKGKAADRPALMVPPPPPRVIEPAEPLPAEPVPVADLPSPPTGAPARPPRRDAPPKPGASEAKPDPKAAEPPALPPVAEVPPPASPPVQLRTPQTADTSGAAKAVRTTIDSARGLLASVDFGLQSNDRKKAYNDAKLLMQQAEDALKQGNLAFAQGVANKAETLAKELAGR
jgi:hypothetical protein